MERMQLLLKRILYKRKKAYVKRTRYLRKHRTSFREINRLWCAIQSANLGYRDMANALDSILINNQKNFRIYYFDDNDVFDMIKIVETVRNRDLLRRTTTGRLVCFKLINDLRITNTELYLKYRLLF